MTDNRVNAAKMLGAPLCPCASCHAYFLAPHGVLVREVDTGVGTPGDPLVLGHKHACCSLHCAIQIDLFSAKTLTAVRQRDAVTLATRTGDRWSIRPEGTRMLSEEALEATGQR